MVDLHIGHISHAHLGPLAAEEKILMLTELERVIPADLTKDLSFGGEKIIGNIYTGWTPRPDRSHFEAIPF